MKPGKFISLEGGEGAGKSTQARILAAALSHKGIDVVLTREPGGTPGAEAIRQLLLARDEMDWNPRAEALLFAAARSDHVAQLIRPALAAGKWVVCDRFLDSSRAYQGGGSGLSDAVICGMHDIGSEGLLPDMTLLFDVSPNVAVQRLSARDVNGSDRIGGRGVAYHERVRKSFANLAVSEPGRFATINADGSETETHALVMAAINTLLDGTA